MPTPLSARRPRSSRLGERTKKLGSAVLVFGAIVGGYVTLERNRAAATEASLTLPDAVEPSSACTLWFVGSSTVFKWRTLGHDFAEWDVHNRGVNGAMIPQIVRWFDNEPPGAPPAAIIFYSGENDIAGGASATRAFAEFQRFMAAKTTRYGALPVIALSLKPSPVRWPQRAAQSAFNDALRRYAAARADLGYIDIRPLMLTNGRPGPYYVADGVHMNADGYARWTRMLRTALPRMLPRRTVARCTGTDKRG